MGEKMKTKMNTKEQNLALRVLREAAWLKDYPKQIAESLVAEGQLVNLDIGEWAQAEGDDRSGLFVVIDGLLHSYYAPLGDRVIMIGFAEPGSVIGHATRYSGGPRLVTAVCAEPSIVLEVSESALDRVARESPEIWRVIATFAYNNMRNALRLAAEVISLQPRERIAARLLTIPKTNPDNEPPVIKVSQELLGEMIGVTRKTVNQHLSAFERDGLIRVGYGQIELLYLPGIEAIASG